MKKSVLTQEMTGCFTRFIFVIAIEILISIICIKGLGMSGFTTPYVIFSVLCVICAFAIYYDDEYNDTSFDCNSLWRNEDIQ